MNLSGVVFTALAAGTLAAAAPAGPDQAEPADAQEIQGAIPVAYALDRYSYIWEKSPFTLSSVAEEPVAGFAVNFALVGQGMIGGKAYVRILDKTSQQRFTLAEGEPANGIELVSLESADNPLESMARLRKGGEIGVIRFDPALLTAAAAPVVPQPAGGTGNPGVPPPNVQNPGQQPPSAPNIPTPRRRRIIIPSTR